MWKYLIKKGYVCLIFAIGNNKKNITQLSKDVGMTISHLARVLEHWEREGIITKRITKEKASEIFLTELGKKLNIILRDIDHMARMAESRAIRKEEEWKKNQKLKEKSSLIQEEKSSTQRPQKKKNSKSTEKLSEQEPLTTQLPTTKQESEECTNLPK